MRKTTTTFGSVTVNWVGFKGKLSVKKKKKKVY